MAACPLLSPLPCAPSDAPGGHPLRAPRHHCRAGAGGAGAAGTGAGGVGGTGRSAEEPKQLQVGACSGLIPSGSCSPGKGRDGRQ